MEVNLVLEVVVVEGVVLGDVLVGEGGFFCGGGGVGSDVVCFVSGEVI